MPVFVLRGIGLAVLGSAIGFVIPGGAARAADAPQIEEVVVTARRIAEDIQKVPVAVVAHTGEKIDQLVINTVLDLNKLAPGFQTASCGSNRDTCPPVIRGQGTAFATGQASVQTYFAESPIVEGSTYDLANIQIVEGPQGTLFGEVSTGGVVLYTPRKPTNTFEGYASVQTGNYRYVQVEGAVSGPIIADRLMVRLAGQFRKRHGFTNGVPAYGGANTDLDNVDKKQLRASIVFKPLSFLENDTTLIYRKTNSNGSGQTAYYVDPNFMNPGIRNLTPAQTGLNLFYFTAGYIPPPGLTWGQLILQAQAKNYAAGPFVEFTNFDKHLTTINHAVVNKTIVDVVPDNGLTLNYIFSMNWTSSQGTNCCDIDGTDVPVVDGSEGVWAAGATSLTTGPKGVTGGWPSRAIAHEVQLVGKLFDDRLDWQAGGYLRTSGSRKFIPAQGTIIVFGRPQGDPASAAFCASTSAPANTPCSQFSKSQSKSKAIFGQATYEVVSNVHITGGIRKSVLTSQTDTTSGPVNSFNFLAPGQPAGTAPTLVNLTTLGRSPFPNATVVSSIVPKNKATTYTVTGDWQITPEVMVYLSQRTGYKPGGVNNNATPGSPNRLFGPEKLKEIEAGVKAQFSLGDTAIRFNASAFRDKYGDIQRSTVIPGTATTATNNIADAIIRGIEADATFKFTDWFSVYGTFAYTDAYNTRYTDTNLCSSLYYLKNCVGAPAGAVATLDHAKGTGVINGVAVTFEPDLYADAAKYKWSIESTLKLEPWTQEDIRITTSLYYISSTMTNAINTSQFIGYVPLTQPTFAKLYPTNLYLNTPRYLADLRLDWRNVAGKPIDITAGATNLFNKKYNISSGGGFTIGGTLLSQVVEPRMIYVGAKYRFGQ